MSLNDELNELLDKLNEMLERELSKQPEPFDPYYNVSFLHPKTSKTNDQHNRRS